MLIGFFSKAFPSIMQIKSANKSDFSVVISLIAVAFCLSCINYLGNYEYVVSLLNQCGLTSISENLNTLINQSQRKDFAGLVFWVLIIIFFYLVPPVIIILIVFKEKLSHYGLGTKGAFKDYHLYVIMLMVMIPLVVFFSKTESFQERYPFYDLQQGEQLFPRFIAWELLYFIQFFALEFFFRGFMLHTLKKRFGFYSVFIMMIPYCMIHFGKPFPETLGAIIAGIVLGALSIKSNSIWLGVLIHYSVAITMDICALYQKNLI